MIQATGTGNELNQVNEEPSKKHLLSAVNGAAASPVMAAVHSLLSVCDGAAKEDAMGYNAIDAGLSRYIVEVDKTGGLDDEALWVAWRMLAKYKRQLSGFGINYDDIPRPKRESDLGGVPGKKGEAKETAARLAGDQAGEKAFKEAKQRLRERRSGELEKSKAEAKAAKQREKFRKRIYSTGDGPLKHGDSVALSFPYDPFIVAATKKIRGAKFSGETKTWTVSLSKAAAVAMRDFFISHINDEHPFEIDEAVSSLFESIDSWADDPKQPEPRIETFGTTGVKWVFEYNSSLVTAVKNVQSARFNREDKIWYCQLNFQNVDKILATALAGFQVSPDVFDLIEKFSSELSQILEISHAQAADVEIPGLGAELKPFQKAGVVYLTKAERAILGDEMGLGKTVQALATLEKVGAYPALIICPSSVKLNWRKEVKKWLPGRRVAVFPAGGGKKAKAENEEALKSADIIIMNYERLGEFFGLSITGKGKTSQVKKEEGSLAERLGKENFAAVIADESHFLKSRESRRTRFVKEVSSGVRWRFLLTGTFLVNRPIEIVPQLSIIDRLGDFGGFWTFAKRYCDAKNSGFGWNLSGHSNLGELHEALRKTCFVRRLKKDVLGELPAKQRSIVPVELERPARYQRAKKEFLKFLKEDVTELLAKEALSSKKEKLEGETTEAEGAGEVSEAAEGYKPPAPDEALIEQMTKTKVMRALRAKIITQLNTLRRISGEEKVKAASEWISDFMEGSDEKLVVFFQHVEVLEALRKALAPRYKIVSITGSTPTEERQATIDLFQEDESTRLIFCTKAAGIGVTLTAASNVLLVETGWTPGEMDQMEDRCHRFGQTYPVNCWYLAAEDTIDAMMIELVEKKRRVLSAVMDGQTESEHSHDTKTSVAWDIVNSLSAEADAAGNKFEHF